MSDLWSSLYADDTGPIIDDDNVVDIDDDIVDLGINTGSMIDPFRDLGHYGDPAIIRAAVLNGSLPLDLLTDEQQRALQVGPYEPEVVSEDDLLNGDPDLTGDTTADDLQVSAYMSTLQGTAAGVIKGMGPPSAGGSGKKSIEEEVMEILQNQALQGGGIGIEINPKDGDSFLLKLPIALPIPGSVLKIKFRNPDGTFVPLPDIIGQVTTKIQQAGSDLLALPGKLIEQAGAIFEELKETGEILAGTSEEDILGKIKDIFGGILGSPSGNSMETPNWILEGLRTKLIGVAKNNAVNNLPEGWFDPVSAADTVTPPELEDPLAGDGGEPPNDEVSPDGQPPADGEPPDGKPPLDGEPSTDGEPPNDGRPPLDGEPPDGQPPSDGQPNDNVPPDGKPPLEGEPPNNEPPDGEPPPKKEKPSDEGVVTPPDIQDPPDDKKPSDEDVVVPPDLAEPPNKKEPPTSDDVVVIPPDITEPPDKKEPPTADDIVIPPDITEPPDDEDPITSEPPPETLPPEDSTEGGGGGSGGMLDRTSDVFSYRGNLDLDESTPVLFKPRKDYIVSLNRIMKENMSSSKKGLFDGLV